LSTETSPRQTRQNESGNLFNEGLNISGSSGAVNDGEDFTFAADTGSANGSFNLGEINDAGGNFFGNFFGSTSPANEDANDGLF
jgi:hypothetical protein